MRRAVAILLATAFLGAGRASADADPQKLAEAKRLASEAVTAFTGGDFARALDAFRRADAAAPNARLLYDIGLCQLRLGQPAEAARSFDLFLQRAAADPRTPAKSLASAHEELRKLAGDWVKLAPRVSPDDAQLEVDGARIAPGPIYVARAAEHRVRVSAPGFMEQLVTVRPPPTGGAEFEVTLVQRVSPHPAPPAVAKPAPKALPVAVLAPAPRPAARNHLPTWVATGVAAALAVPSGYFGVKALSLRGEINGRGTQCGDPAAPGYDESCGAWHTAARNADVFGGLAGAAAATGAVLWFVAPAPGGAQAGVGSRF